MPLSHAWPHAQGGIVTLSKVVRALAGTAGVLIAAALMLGAWVRFAPRHTPEGQPPLSRLSMDGAGGLFDSQEQKTRVLVLLSPT